MSDLAFGAKQTYEEYYVEFNFVNDLAEEDTVATATVVAMDGVVDVTDTLTDVDEQTISGTSVFVWVMGGSTGVTYVITCQIVSSVYGEKYEAEADLPVLET